MVDTALLEQAILNSGYKKTYLAKRVGLTPTGFYNCVNNKAEFRISHVGVLRELLCLSTAQTERIFFARNGV